MFPVLFHIQANPSLGFSYAYCNVTHQLFDFYSLVTKGSNTQYTLLYSVIESSHKSNDMLYKNNLGVKKQGSTNYFYIFCMRLKDVISGRGQGLLRFNHFVDATIYNHVQTNRINACRQTIET